MSNSFCQDYYYLYLLTFSFMKFHAQMDWHEMESILEKLHRDLTQSWEHLRAIAKHESFTDSISTEKKMKSAKFLSEAAERLKVLEVVHRRIMNRVHKLYLYMGMVSGKAETQKVIGYTVYIIRRVTS